MADKAPYNVFSVFIRKIGYSVGLEHTFERLRDFAELYARSESLTLGRLLKLLHAPKPEGWGLKDENRHILDFLRSIEVIDIRRGEVSVLELGEALGILCKTSTEEAFVKQLRILLIHQLILSDGDVFLNGLASCFDGDEFAARMTRLIHFKWDVLEREFASDYQRRAIYSAVNMEVQSNNPGSRGRMPGREVDLTRLKVLRAPLAVAGSARPNPSVSSQYIKKSLPRRKAWAVSLGLAESDGTPTATGHRVLANMASAYQCGPCCVAVWPLVHELQTPMLLPLLSSQKFHSLNFWQSLSLVVAAVTGAIEETEVTSGLGPVRRIYDAYRSLNLRQSMIRRELGSRVLYRCIIMRAIESGSIENWPEFLTQANLLDTRGFHIRKSVSADYALSFEGVK